MLIRDAQAADLPGITTIYNDVLLTSTAIYNETPVTLEERIDWWQTRLSQGYPVIVAEERDRIAGFASFGGFRAAPGYRFTVEHSVHVNAEWRGRGVGSQLLTELIARARVSGKHVMIGGVDAENLASLRFHERLGFERVAHLREVGFKFGRYLDLVFVQYLLTPAAFAR